MTEHKKATDVARPHRRMAREPESQITGSPSSLTVPEAKPKRGTKTDMLLDLLRRDQGATLEQMVADTGWLAHTTRAALTGLKKKGHTVISDKGGGVRTYRIRTEGNVA